jgi:hypothetical protein
MSKEDYRSHLQEATPQASPEHQQRPVVFDVLERGAQLHEMAIARGRRGFSREKNKAFDDECRAVADQLTDEKTRLYTSGTNSDRLILTTYSTLSKAQFPSFFPDDSVNLRIGLHAKKDREFIARFTPLYNNEDALREELRKAQEELERKRATLRHREEYRLLAPEEAAQRRREARVESNRRWRQRSKEKRGLPAEQQPPAQIFPPTTTLE